MPISTPPNLIRIEESQFKQLDYSIMGAAFEIHNKYGRLLREEIYQSALLEFCQTKDFDASKEAPVKIQHKAFNKTYYLDLLVGSSVIYELKATESISAQHESQLLNYLLLCGQGFGKIVNFGAKSVETRFVSTTISASERYQFSITEDDWKSFTEYCQMLPHYVRELLEDLGTRLDKTIYTEALLQTIEPTRSLITDVEFYSGDQFLGCQPQYLLDAQTSLHISTLNSGHRAYAHQLERLMNHTRLKQMQWITALVQHTFN